MMVPIFLMPPPSLATYIVRNLSFFFRFFFPGKKGKNLTFFWDKKNGFQSIFFFDIYYTFGNDGEMMEMQSQFDERAYFFQMSFYLESQVPYF